MSDTIKVRANIEVEVDDVLVGCSLASIHKHLEEYDALGEMLDVIGKKTCLEHFGITEKEDA